MDEQKATEILSELICSDNSLQINSAASGFAYVRWQNGEEHITLDGRYTKEQLESIVWWMSNK